MKTCSTVRSSDWGENTRTPSRAFLPFPDKNRICPHQHRMGSFRGLRARVKGRLLWLCVLLRPIDTDILCENSPAFAATSRFIAYQTRIFYHICTEIATVFFCDKCRTLPSKTKHFVQTLQKTCYLEDVFSRKAICCVTLAVNGLFFAKNFLIFDVIFKKSNK